MARQVALVRGINVGTAKQVPMSQLAQVFVNLGARNVTTVLRSGSVVFDAVEQSGADSIDGDAVEAELLRVAGVSARTLVLSAPEFVEIAAANPLTEVATDGSKLFVSFLSEPVGSVEVPDAAMLLPEQLRLGDRAVYQWFPDGSMQTKVPKAFWSQFGAVVTARNANTVARILTLLSEKPDKR